MTTQTDWQISPQARPAPENYQYDLDAALSSVVSVSAHVPEDAFTAGILGTERSGSGVLIRQDGLVLTVGYLITEAETVWLGFADGRSAPGHVIGFDQETGFGLVQALARVSLPALSLGDPASLAFGDRVVLGGAKGRSQSIAARLVARQEFAGYWEYVLDEALFTAPAHPYWGGAPLIGPKGDLLGVGSLRLEQANAGDKDGHLNMVVPVDLLSPVLDDLLTTGRRKGPARPWLGVYAVDVDDSIVIAGMAEKGPAARAGLNTHDTVLGVGGESFDTLAEFFRAIWALGPAGVRVPLTVNRDGETIEVSVISGDRNDFLKAPKLH